MNSNTERADLNGTLAVLERGNGQPCGDLDVAGLDKECKRMAGNGVLALVSAEYLGWPTMKLLLSISDCFPAQHRICNLQLHLYPSFSIYFPPVSLFADNGVPTRPSHSLRQPAWRIQQRHCSPQM